MVDRQIRNLRARLQNDWRHISDALMGVASAKVIEFVGNLVPGFHDQFHREHPDSRSSV